MPGVIQFNPLTIVFGIAAVILIIGLLTLAVFLLRKPK
jgi:hypothetical protein